LVFALLLLTIEVLLPEETGVEIKNQHREIRRHRSARAAAVIVLLGLPYSLFSSPSGALRDYNSGQYDQALKEYERLLERKKDDPAPL